eukprot:556972-Prymnesium_polylepis.1
MEHQARDCAPGYHRALDDRHTILWAGHSGTRQQRASSPAHSDEMHALAERRRPTLWPIAIDPLTLKITSPVRNPAL